jgi:hypothetical protein
MAEIGKRASSFSWPDFIDFIKTWFLLLGIDLGLRLSSFKSVQKRLTSDPNPKEIASPEQVPGIIQRERWLVYLASHYHLFNMTCLRRSLAFQILLAHHGIPADLRFGVRYAAEKIEAHAWLEYNGSPISEPEAITGRFATLAGQISSRDQIL